MCVFVCVCLQAHIVFKPNVEQQRKCENCTDSGVDGLFRVTYDVSRDHNAGELQVSKQRLFIHLGNACHSRSSTGTSR